MRSLFDPFKFDEMMRDVVAGGGSGLLEFITSMFKLGARHDEGKDAAHYLFLLGIVLAYFVLRLLLRRIFRQRKNGDEGGE